MKIMIVGFEQESTENRAIKHLLHSITMADFFKDSRLNSGAKGLVFIDDKILIYRRDGNTRKHPFKLDIPGGKSESGETPFETFKRETKEEFDLDISEQQIGYTKRYTGISSRGAYIWFVVAHLSKGVEEYIRMNDEGVECMLMDPEDYLKRQDAWPLFQNRTSRYIHSHRQEL